jgi:hypothetical protein
MRAFFIGLLFVLLIGVLAGIGFLLFPVFLLIAFIFRVLLSFGIVIFFIWLVGKFILWLSKK